MYRVSREVVALHPPPGCMISIAFIGGEDVKTRRRMLVVRDSGIPHFFSSSNPLASSNFGHEREMDDSFLVDLDNEDDLLEADNDVVEHMEEDIDGDLADIEALNYDDLILTVYRNVMNGNEG